MTVLAWPVLTTPSPSGSAVAEDHRSAGRAGGGRDCRREDDRLPGRRRVDRGGQRCRRLGAGDDAAAVAGVPGAVGDIEGPRRVQHRVDLDAATVIRSWLRCVNVGTIHETLDADVPDTGLQPRRHRPGRRCPAGRAGWPLGGAACTGAVCASARADPASKAPISHVPTRGKTRWSMVGHAGELPPLIPAGPPSAIVRPIPPLSTSGARLGSALVIVAGHVVSPNVTLLPRSRMTPPSGSVAQSAPAAWLATIVFWRSTVPSARRI